MSLLRTFSPPPSQSFVGGRPLFDHALLSCSGAPPTCSTNGTRASARRAQNGSNSTCPGDLSPHGRCGIQTAFKSLFDCVFEFRDGERRIVERHHADAEQPLVIAAECAHCAVVRARRAVAHVRRHLRTGRKRQRHAMCREHQLAFEAEHVERGRALGGIECAQAPGFPSTSRSADRPAQAAPPCGRRCDGLPRATISATSSSVTTEAL